MAAIVEDVKKLLPWMERMGEPKASFIAGAVWFLLIIVIAVLVILFVPKAWYGPFGMVSFIVVVLAAIVGAAAQRRSRSRDVAVDLPEAVGHEVDQLLAQGDRVAAMKYVRAETGLRPRWRSAPSTTTLPGPPTTTEHPAPTTGSPCDKGGCTWCQLREYLLLPAVVAFGLRAADQSCRLCGS